MKTYPYIGEGIESNNIVLFSSDKYGMCLKGLTCATGTGGAWCERAFKNITPEYLANTYGEVASPEHAEFIIELAKANKLRVYPDFNEIKANFFTLNKSSALFFYRNESSIDKDRCKKITIPLPPKADKQEVSEFPQVGDEVCWSNGKRKGELKSICDGWAWIKDDSGEFISLMSKFIQKPKTPEEELFDRFWGEVALFMNRGNLDENCFKHAFLRSVNKKPQ